MLKLFAIIFSLFISVAHADTICTGSVPNTFTPGTIISSSQMNANFAYYSSCINTNAAKNGVNSSITALLGLTTPLDPGVGGSPIYNATTVGGTADAITVTATRTAISAFTYTAGNIVTLVATGTNTTAATINVNSLGVKNILKYSFSGLVALTGGEVTSGNPAFLYYDGTQFVLINIPPMLGVVTTLASASTADLGTIASHNVNVTGTTTITSFGSSASTAQPYYFIRFSSALTITYNATSMITPNALDMSIGANDTVEAVYGGSGNWRIVTRVAATPTTAIGTVNGLTISNNVATPTTKLDIVTTGSSVLESSSSGSFIVGAASLTLDAGTTGANGLDTGSLTTSSWYYIYLISNGTTTASLLSLSATAPTMPSGYIYKYRIGAQRTGGSSTFLRVLQKGNKAQYVVVTSSTTPNLPIMVSGSSGSITTPTWTSTSTANFVPTTASSILGSLMGFSGSSGSGSMVAPNNNYGALRSTTNPPPIAVNLDNLTGETIVPFGFALESTNIFYASNNAASSFLCARGWVDVVNAN